MSIYTKPTCPKNTKLIKSRCECKKTNAKTPKKKTTNNKIIDLEKVNFLTLNNQGVYK